MSVRLLRDAVKLRGVPNQGPDFFKVWYPVFRGKGVLLKSETLDHFGLFSAINWFFTATSVLYLGCEPGAIEAGVSSSNVKAMDAVCSDPERRNLPTWGSALTRSLARNTEKNASNFRISFPEDTSNPRDRDLVVHYLEDLFPPAPSSESAESLTRFLKEVHSTASRLMLGGFYILAAPVTYNGIDLVLSGIAATTSPQRSLVYTGMILYANDLPLWVFRIEPMHPATLESQKVMALSRLMRYPPVLQNAVKALMPTTSQIGSGIEPTFEDSLSSRVTPTDTLTSLFRVATGPYPREVLNKLGTFQPKYSEVIDRARSTADLKIQIRSIMELLYDLALSSQRRCSH